MRRWLFYVTTNIYARLPKSPSCRRNANPLYLCMCVFLFSYLHASNNAQHSTETYDTIMMKILYFCGKSFAIQCRFHWKCHRMACHVCFAFSRVFFLCHIFVPLFSLRQTYDEITLLICLKENQSCRRKMNKSHHKCIINNINVCWN